MKAAPARNATREGEEQATGLTVDFIRAEAFQSAKSDAVALLR
jgi:hypothetical protein